MGNVLEKDGQCFSLPWATKSKLLDMLAHLGQILLHPCGILILDDRLQGGQFLLDTLDLMRRIRIEQDLRQEVIILREQAAGDVHVTLEGSTRRILMFHRRSKDHGGGEGDS